MSNNKQPEKKLNEAHTPGWYKGYEMRWLKSEPSHPDYYLVAEYEAKHGEVK